MKKRAAISQSMLCPRCAALPAQDLAGALLDAEAKIGELLKAIPDKKATSGGGSRSLPEGISHKQSQFYQTLADNRDLIEQVKAEAIVIT